jgi:anthranilate synthase component 2
MRVLMVDNYDSFTYNLVHLLEELGAEVVVRRSDEIDVDEARRLGADRLVVCLGHQAIVEAYGGEVGRARELVHGKATLVSHDGHGIFEGLPSTIPAGRYHSLGAASVPPELHVTATAADGEVMAVRHQTHPIDGVQFHPESVLTPDGPALLANFLAAAPVGARRAES